jgi:hypothetical protein
MGSFADHGFLGFSTALIASWLLGYTDYHPFILCWVAYVLGNFFPDVDSETSKIHRFLLWPKLFGHRWKHWGHAHSILGDFLFSIPLLVIDVFMHVFLGFSWWMFIFFNIGCFFHCMLDDRMKSKGNKRTATKLW